MDEAFRLLLGYGGIGPFLAYQLVTDLNYSAVLDFSEMDFVMAGPGARSGLRKCFTDPGDYYDGILSALWPSDRSRSSPAAALTSRTCGDDRSSSSTARTSSVRSTSTPASLTPTPKASGTAPGSSRSSELSPHRSRCGSRLSGASTTACRAVRPSTDQLDPALLQVDLDHAPSALIDLTPHVVASQDRFLPLVA